MRATPSPAILAVLRECLTYFRGTLYIQHTCERPRVSATTAFDHDHLAPELLVLGLERDSSVASLLCTVVSSNASTLQDACLP